MTAETRELEDLKRRLDHIESRIEIGGIFTAPVFARPRDSFHVDYGPLGSISVRFV